MRYRRWAAAVAPGLVLVLASGCGDDDELEPLVRSHPRCGSSVSDYGVGTTGYATPEEALLSETGRYDQLPDDLSRYDRHDEEHRFVYRLEQPGLAAEVIIRGSDGSWLPEESTICPP
jgi:hypothetical protein